MSPETVSGTSASSIAPSTLAGCSAPESLEVGCQLPVQLGVVHGGCVRLGPTPDRTALPFAGVVGQDQLVVAADDSGPLRRAKERLDDVDVSRVYRTGPQQRSPRTLRCGRHDLHLPLPNLTLAVSVPDWVVGEISTRLGRNVTGIRRIRGTEGGHSGVMRRIAEFSDSTSAFVKIALDPSHRRSLRREIEVYEAFDEPFMLRKLGHVDQADQVALILDNAERATWPPPWNDLQIGAVLEVLDRLRTLFTPNWLVWRGGPAGVIAKDSGWPLVAADPDPFLSLGYVSESWLARNLEQLLAAADPRTVRGSALVHLDVRSDNICFLDDQIKLIDWSAARLGHPNFDQHYWGNDLAG